MVDEDELREGGEREGVLDCAREEGVAYALERWELAAKEVNEAGES